MTSNCLTLASVILIIAIYSADGKTLINFSAGGILINSRFPTNGQGLTSLGKYL